jgi:hypothetical protein
VVERAVVAAFDQMVDILPFPQTCTHDSKENGNRSVSRAKACKTDISLIGSPTKGFRFHDLRHHAVTELAESQASEQTTMAIAGHVSPGMLAHYSHVRMDAKRKALDALSSGLLGPGYGTNNDTNAPSAEMPYPQVIEMNGRLEGTRTPDLHRVNLMAA